jgi:hypothetical protein
MTVSKTAKVLQFFGIAVNMALLAYVGLVGHAVVVGLIGLPAGIAACFD